MIEGEPLTQPEPRDGRPQTLAEVDEEFDKSLELAQEEAKKLDEPVTENSDAS